MPEELEETEELGCGEDAESEERVLDSRNRKDMSKS